MLFIAPVTYAEPVQNGIDVLVDSRFEQLAGTRVGLITNHTGVDRRGHSSIQRLHDSPDVELVRVFSPEHGVTGQLDVPVIENGVHVATGIPVASLYGESRRPTSEMLADIDTLVFDIQDIGTRFYTYISTMGNAMIAAAEHDIAFVVLDRPNPINGQVVAGPVLDDGLQSFVGFHTLPIRHGMTVGELALMMRAELSLDLDLTVVRMKGWSRSDYFDETGLRWINPSPNMRSLEAALLYPGIGLLETTNVSVGRGTDTPFNIFGAPWLDRNALVTYLRSRSFEGVAIEPVIFVPDSSTFAGERCEGVRISIVNRDQFESVRFGLEVAVYLARTYPNRWQSNRYLRLLGNTSTLDGIRGGRSVMEIEKTNGAALEAFRSRRAKYLLYE